MCISIYNSQCHLEKSLGKQHSEWFPVLVLKIIYLNYGIQSCFKIYGFDLLYSKTCVTVKDYNVSSEFKVAAPIANEMTYKSRMRIVTL